MRVHFRWNTLAQSPLQIQTKAYSDVLKGCKNDINLEKHFCLERIASYLEIAYALVCLNVRYYRTQNTCMVMADTKLTVIEIDTGTRRMRRFPCRYSLLDF